MISPKKIPLRTCIVCKKQLPKSELMRVVRSPEGKIVFDKTGKANGRGAYLCDDKLCVEKCLKKHLLNKVYHTEVPQETYDRLAEEYADQ